MKNLLRLTLVLIFAFSFANTIHADVTTGLVNWWKFDGNATDSAGSNNGTLQNGPTFTTGVVGQALSLDGEDDYVSAAQTCSTLPCTVSAWVYADSLPMSRNGLFRNNETEAYAGLGIYAFNNGALSVRMGDASNGPTYDTAPGLISTGAWHHYTVVANSLTDVKVYIDGASVALSSYGSAPSYSPGSGATTIGRAWRDSSNGYYKNLDGRIDDLRIYNRALTASDASELYTSVSVPPDTSPPSFSNIKSLNITTTSATISWDTSELADSQVEYGLTTSYDLQSSLNPSLATSHSQNLPNLEPNSIYHYRVISRDSAGNLGQSSDNTFTTAHGEDVLSGLVSWWKFDGNAIDSTGSNHGTLFGDPEYIAGKIGQAIYLDGVGDYIDIADYLPGTNNFTISAWFQLFSGSHDTHPIFGNNQNTPMLGFLPGYDIWRSLRQYSGGSEVYDWSTESFVAKPWHHITMTVDQTAMKATLYIDGVSQGSKDMVGPGGYASSNSAFRWIGRDYASYWRGLIDDARLYNRVLTPTEVLNVYNSGGETGQQNCSTGCNGEIVVTATLDGQPWPASGTGSITYALSGIAGDISNSTVPFNYENVATDEIYTITHISGAPPNSNLESISPISSQFLPNGAAVGFNLEFTSISCPLEPQAGRTIISLDPSLHLGSSESATYHMAGPYFFPSSLPAGTYDITLVAYDGHVNGLVGSGIQNQQNEIYYLKLLDESGGEIVSTNSTVDIPNDENFVTTLVNSALPVATDIHSVETWHGAYIDNSDYNSLAAVCAVFDEFPTYELSNDGPQSANKGGSDVFAQSIITKTLVSGGMQPINLSVSGLPEGVTVDGISNQGCAPTCQSVITFRIAPTAPIGTFPITITGDLFDKETTFDLSITGDPLSVSCSADPQFAELGEVVTWTADVSGGVPPYTFKWAGKHIPTAPAPDTNPYTITYSTVGNKSGTVIITDNSGEEASCPAEIVHVNIKTNFEEF